MPDGSHPAQPARLSACPRSKRTNILWHSAGAMVLEKLLLPRTPIRLLIPRRTSPHPIHQSKTNKQVKTIASVDLPRQWVEAEEDEDAHMGVLMVRLIIPSSSSTHCSAISTKSVEERRNKKRLRPHATQPGPSDGAVQTRRRQTDGRNVGLVDPGRTYCLGVASVQSGPRTFGTQMEQEVRG